MNQLRESQSDWSCVSAKFSGAVGGLAVLIMFGLAGCDRSPASLRSGANATGESGANSAASSPSSGVSSGEVPNEPRSGPLSVGRPQETPIATDHLYPYLVPAEYPSPGAAAPPGFERPIGNGLRLVLVLWSGMVVDNILPHQLEQVDLSPDQAFEIALKNFRTYVSSDDFVISRHEGPGGVKLLVFAGHLASSAVALPDLFSLSQKHLESDRLVVCVPQRDSMVVFPACKLEQERAVMELVRANESDARKPLTFDLFDLDQAGLRPRALRP